MGICQCRESQIQVRLALVLSLRPTIGARKNIGQGRADQQQPLAQATNQLSLDLQEDASILDPSAWPGGGEKGNHLTTVNQPVILKV